MESIQPASSQFATFSAAERCDACGAQAKVRAHLATGQLLFCAHHARRFVANLKSVARLEYADAPTLDLVLEA